MSTLDRRQALKDAQNLASNTNPAKKYYKWESTNKCFSYFDKEKGEKGENVLVKLPFRFVTLGRPLFNVKGYNEPNNCGIWSNEVRSVNDHLTVKMFDKLKTTIAEGTWKEVKDACVSKGGKYHLSIYGFDLETQEIINISIKGLGIQEWGSLYRKCSGRLADEIVIVNGYIDGKKGATKFTYPKFELERSLSDSEIDPVFDALDELNIYLEKYLKAPKTEPAVELAEQEVDEDDLDF
jgi:hypothetical protein